MICNEDDFTDTLSSFNFTPYTSKIYECTLMRLKTADIDQEVKERAISCMGQIICNLGDYLQVIIAPDGLLPL